MLLLLLARVDIMYVCLLISIAIKCQCLFKISCIFLYRRKKNLLICLGIVKKTPMSKTQTEVAPMRKWKPDFFYLSDIYNSMRNQFQLRTLNRTTLQQQGCTEKLYKVYSSKFLAQYIIFYLVDNSTIWLKKILFVQYMLNNIFLCTLFVSSSDKDIPTSAVGSMVFQS